MNSSVRPINDATKGAIAVKNFTKKFNNGLSVFEDISFKIGSGDIVSIVGPSGSGKSTLLRCIIGLDGEFTGSVMIDNRESKEYLNHHRIAFVLQKYSNFRWLDVNDNVATAFHGKTLSKKKEKSIISAILEEVGLLGFEDYYINQLSGGMQQRVAVARALVQDTDIIAMDEPFASLDMKIRESLQLTIKEVNRKHRKTVLFVTHDIEEAIFLSDKIIALTSLPVKDIKVYGKEELCFKNELSASVKYRNDFTEMRRSIENYILNT